MARIRKLVLAIAAASAFSSGVANALGLGEISLQSALNQPLVAEIELLDVRGLSPAEVMPALASADEFHRAGVDRPFFLNDLQFSPVINAQGKSIIRISSSKPVREPYLNFLVEVNWPSGRALREYTVLLDPPLYNPQNTADVAPQLALAAPAPQSQSQSQPAPRVQPARTAPSTVRPVVAQAEPQSEYRTVAQDTLWEIASRHQRGNATVQQTMLAIQDLNPSAFINDNINLLKTGQVLRLPDEQQIAARTRREAIALVAEQNAAWQAWRQARSLAGGARQLDATRRTVAGPAPERVELGDSLRLVAGTEGKSAEGQDAGSALADKLAVAQENLDTSRRASAELEGRMGDLQSQLDKLQRLIELKDSQLARLQARLAEEEQAAQQAPEVTATPAAEQSPELQQQNSAPQQSSPQPSDGAQTTDAAPGAFEAPLQSANEQPAPAPAEVLQSVVPAASAEPSTASDAGLQGYVDRLLADPLLLGAIGGGSLLALLLALMALSRRNAMKEAELQEGLGLSDDDQAFSEELALPSSSFDDLGGVSRSGQSASKAGDATDVLGEANIYIAYGRFNQAAELLLNALDEEPERRDLRLKLMEVFAEQGDRAGFQRQEAELREVGGAESEIRKLKSRYPDIAQAPVSPATAGAMAVAATAGATTLAGWQDAEEAIPSLDELSFDDELQVSPALATPNVAEDLDKPLPAYDDLDFDLQLDSEPALNVTEPVVPAAVAPIAEPAAEETLADLEFTLDDPFESLVGEDEVENEDDLPEFELPTLDAIEPPARDNELSTLPEDFDLSLAEAEQLLSGDEPEPSAVDDFEAELERVNAQLDTLTDELEMPAVEPPPFDITDLGPLEDDEDFDFLSGTNETATKLDLARAYIDMGDSEGARDILDEVLGEGDDSQKNEARELMARLS